MVRAIGKLITTADKDIGQSEVGLGLGLHKPPAPDFCCHNAPGIILRVGILLHPRHATTLMGLLLQPPQLPAQPQARTRPLVGGT